MPTTPLPEPMVRLRDLRVTFSGGRKPVHAVSLEVQRGEVVALIGESGSGKSVTLRTLLRLHPERRTQIGGQVQVAERGAGRPQPLVHAAQARVVAIAKVHREGDPARNHVARIGMHLHIAHGAAAVGLLVHGDAPHGLMQAWASWPVTATSYQRWPSAPVTTPNGMSASSSTGPCSK